MDFKKQAEELLKKVLHEYRNRPEWNKKTLGEMVDFYLAKYNEEVKKQIEDELYKQLGSFYFVNTNPQIAITPVMLSDVLYKNAKDISKMITKILYEGIKAKETIREIALKIYEGYDFRDETMKAKKVLPKYLLKALEKRDDEIMKQIEKLKTKPLRIAYKDLIRKMDTFTDEELQKLLNTAYHEKMRYYANRIAKTETHRAFMSKRAKDMLEDDEVEFVKFEMSPAHKKTDICDFYANLDVGYGRGVIPKREMRTLPLHPHCYDKDTEVYTNEGWKFFRDLKGDEEFLSFNPENRKIEFIKAKNFVCWLNNDRMISFKHKHFDLLVTNKHNMAVYKRVTKNGKRVNKFEFVEADKCNNTEFKIPRTAFWDGIDVKTIKIDKFEFETMAFCEFMGYWLSDGSVTKRKKHYQIQIGQQDNQERIYKVIERLGFNPYYAKGYVGFSGNFGAYLMQFGKAKDKFIPKEIKELDTKYLWKFLEAFVSCDGYIRPQKDFKGYKNKPEYLFYTSSKRLADDLGELILKCGYQPSFYLQKVKGKEIEFRNGKYTINEDIWVIRLKRSKNANVSNLEIKEVKYNDLVYCVELEKYNILWVRRNGKTCFSGNCYCIYTPYYKKVKGKRKSWKTAVKETMSKFSEKKQIEILGSREKLVRFKNGEDVEEIFNTIRPKYPIKKYVDILEGKEYNSLMKKYEEAILKKFENFDVSSKEKAIESFEKLWRNKEKFLTHIEKRKGLGHIENEFDYLEKTLRCLSECEKVNIAIYKKSWDNIYFEAEINNWAVIFNEEGDLMTSYKIDENMPHFLDVHKKADNIIKGVKNELQQTFKRIYNSLKNNTK